jgi:asparagine synthase (glutamine-hydrolysing)
MDVAAFDESVYAGQVAEKLGTEHHLFRAHPELLATLPSMVWHYNEPFADSSAIPTYYLAQMTRQHVTVALNGDAGDENFAGYGRYVEGGLTARYQKVPLPARRAFAAVLGPIPSRPGGAGIWPRARQMVMRGAMSPERRYSLSMMQFDGALLHSLCTPEFAARADVADAGALLADEMTASDAPDLVDEMLAADVNWYLPDALLVKVDIATMAHGLEGRSPLLDHRVMELAASLPSTMKRRDGQSKYIFKRALRRLLPDDILDRPKQGFAVPLEHWFRNELRDLAYEALLGPRAVARGYFRPAAVRRILDEHVSGVRKWNEQLWNLLMLELWHRTFIDERPRVHEGRAVLEGSQSLAKVG